MRRILLVVVAFAAWFRVQAGEPSKAILDYIERYRYIAVEEMINHGIPASITLAQGILESGAGQSELARQSNNHFGIKCHTGWTGDRVFYDDDAKGECFRKYDNAEESFHDHSYFLTSRTRYAELFTLDPTDYKGWAKGLKKAGYATNPEYAERLIKIIEDYDLHIYDKLTPDQLLAMEDHKKMETDPEPEPGPYGEVAEAKGYGKGVFYFNRIPTIIVQQGDTPESIAERHPGRLQQLLKYNDITASTRLEPGTKFYLQPKRNKGINKVVTVKEGATMWTISRDEGVKLSRLYKYNRLEPGQEPATGEVIFLRKKRDTAPALQKSKKETPATRVQKEKPSTKVKEEATPDPNKNNIIMEFEGEDSSDAVEDEGTIKVQIPTPKATPENTEMTAPVKQEPQLSPVLHTVAPKETLYGLSRQYGTTVEQLQKWNSISDNAISIGQQLIVGYK
ncbi:MAG: hypothetical protein ABR95_05995 [Sphingobacteriales bacterium BACL12 MAG-120813-bin55]|jgi:LysM repeat protein|nr:MAG: hypothetical protein ABR95_05995 [Sphingobacteriales bacterium BACL12 MAG-120813-bin55]